MRNNFFSNILYIHVYFFHSQGITYQQELTIFIKKQENKSVGDCDKNTTIQRYPVKQRSA